MKRIFLTILIVLVSVSLGFAANLKVSELTETQTLTDDDLFMVSTYLTGAYTSKYIKKNYLVTSLGITNNAATMTVIDTTDASAYVALFDSATGNLAIKTDTKITFDATTGVLTATGFAGPITGAVTGTASGNIANTLADAAGDIIQGSADNTWARLAIGTAYQIPHVNSGATALAYTSTLGSTSTRLTKIWATDLELTNAPTIGGAAWTTILQPLDGELTALAGLTSAANAIPYFTGSGTAGVISSSADMVSLLGSADMASALTALGGWGVSGSITDEQLVCAETTGGSNLLKSCGAKITYTEPATNTTLCRTGAATTGACTNPVKLASFAWDGGASAVPTASSKRCVVIPTTATVTGVYAIADASTTTHIHVYQDAFATGARSTTVTGAVDIVATLGSQDTTLTSWDKSITAGDEICMSVESNNNAKWLNVVVYGTY